MTTDTERLDFVLRNLPRLHLGAPLYAALPASRDAIDHAMRTTGHPEATAEPIFSADEVEHLWRSQHDFAYHPFTCPNRGDGQHRSIGSDLGMLVPTVRGWICPFCTYTQDWAHASMRSGTPLGTPSAPPTVDAQQLLRALENVRLLAARQRHEPWAAHALRFCAEAGVTGAPLRAGVPLGETP